MAQPSTSHIPRGSSRSSPSDSLQRHQTDVPVETLISHLVASKRSLGSIQHVHRATTILADARSSIESTAALVARTTYLRRSLASQVKILRGVQFELEGAAQAIQVEFQSVIGELDLADRKLTQCVSLLQQTKIEEAFKPAPAQREDRSHYATVQRETLHDFVEEKSVEELKDAMKDAIDNVQYIQQEMTGSIGRLEDDLQEINGLLIDKSPSLSVSGSEMRRPQIAKLLAKLEEHAHAMAEGLHDLVKHFDFCVTAIKHTEGAGAMVAQTMNQADMPDGVDVDTLAGPTQPITEDERTDMLQVLENDAAEVDEVVQEIQDRIEEMESQLTQITSWRRRNEISYTDATEAFKLCDKIGDRLQTHVAETARHSTRWAEEKAKIEDGIVGMEDLSETYDHFLHAYDRLIVEAARRRNVKKQMERVIEETHARLEQLYEADLTERELFRSEQGDYLPADIWLGLNSLPPRFGVSRIDNADESGGVGVDQSMVELPRKTVDDALKRLRAGLRPSSIGGAVRSDRYD